LFYALKQAINLLIYQKDRIAGKFFCHDANYVLYKGCRLKIE
jgi:hypothetical protein